MTIERCRIIRETVKPPRLVPGDRVVLVLSDSTPEREGVERGREVLESLG